MIAEGVLQIKINMKTKYQPSVIFEKPRSTTQDRFSTLFIDHEHSVEVVTYFQKIDMISSGNIVSYVT